LGSKFAMPKLVTRADLSFKSNLGLYVAGFCVIGVLLFGVALWGVIRCYRKRSKTKREKAQGAAFMTVRGVVRDVNFARKVQDLP
jgi:hypothetical protein